MTRRLLLLCAFAALVAAPVGVSAQRVEQPPPQTGPPQGGNQSDFSGFVILGGGEWTPRGDPGDGRPGGGGLDLDIYAEGWADRIGDRLNELMCWLTGEACSSNGAAGGGPAPGTPSAPGDATQPGPEARTLIVRTPLPDAVPGSGQRRILYVRVPAQAAYAGGPVLPGRMALESRLTSGDPRTPEEIVAEMDGAVVYATGGPSAEAGIAGDFEDLQAGPEGGAEAGIAGDFEDLQVPGMDRLLEALAGIVGDFEDLAINEDELDVRALNSAGRSGEELRDSLVEVLEDLLDQSSSLNPRQERRLVDLLDILAGITGDFEDLMGDLDALAGAVALAR